MTLALGCLATSRSFLFIQDWVLHNVQKLHNYGDAMTVIPGPAITQKYLEVWTVLAISVGSSQKYDVKKDKGRKIMVMAVEMKTDLDCTLSFWLRQSQEFVVVWPGDSATQ